jgi:hypothetical protein
MSETAVQTDSAHASPVVDATGADLSAENPFDRDDLVEFKAEDTEAASNIGKMLTAFFFYSLLAMAFVSWWAWSATH